MNKYGGGNHLFSAVKHVQYQDANINAVVWILFGKLWQIRAGSWIFQTLDDFICAMIKSWIIYPWWGCYITDSLFF